MTEKEPTKLGKAILRGGKLVGTRVKRRQDRCICGCTRNYRRRNGNIGCRPDLREVHRERKRAKILLKSGRYELVMNKPLYF